MADNEWLDVDTDWSNVANWSLGHAPTAGENVFINSGSKHIAAFDAHTVLVASITTGQGFTGTCDNLQLGYTKGYFGKPSNVGNRQNGSGRFVIDGGTNQFTAYVYSTGVSPLDGKEALRLKGSHASNKIIAIGGITGVATNAVSDTATIAETDVSNGAQVNLAKGVTWTTVTVSGQSIVNINSGGGTTLSVTDSSTVVCNGTTKITTINCDGTITYNIRPGAGDLADTINLFSQGTMDFTEDPTTGNIGALNWYAGGTWKNNSATPNHITATSVSLKDGGERTLK
jgi:hypothetical protein